jgi:hypothetical protein
MSELGLRGEMNDEEVEHMKQKMTMVGLLAVNLCIFAVKRTDSL